MLRGLLGGRGDKLARVDDSNSRIVQLIGRHGAGAVIDVGANTGQYAQRLRGAGLDLPIVSVEPGMAAHAALVAAAANDPAWTVAPRMALSDVRGSASLNVNSRTDMSSLKPLAEASLAAFPKARPATVEEVTTERLDAVFESLVAPFPKPVFLKIDTQGCEAEVIRGAEAVLEHIVAIQLEMSLLPLYEGETSYLEIITTLDRLGYDLHLMIPGFFSRTLARQLQFDGLFVRRP